MNPSRHFLGTALFLTALSLATLSLAGCQRKAADEAAPAGPEAAASEAAASEAAAARGPEAKPGLSVAEGVLVLPAVKGNPGAAYFALTNGSDKAVTLAAVSVGGVGRTEMHETRGETMSPVDSVAVAPGKTVKFERGGSHVMLFDIAGKIAAGGTAEMTLTFADGDKLSTPLKVEAAGGGMAGMDHGDMH